MTPFVEAVFQSAGRLAELLRAGWREEYAQKGAVGAGGDRTAGIDAVAERIYVEALAPFGRIDSEESGTIEGEGDATIILDPIDGSSNALSGIPYFGSSVALERGGRVREACVVNLACGDFFYKTERGFWRCRLNDPTPRPVERRSRSEVGIFEKAYADPELALALLRQKRKFRSPGAVALSLAYARYVDFVIFAGPRRPYDFSAALWMCEDLPVYRDAALLIVAKSPQTLQNLTALARGKDRT